MRWTRLVVRPDALTRFWCIGGFQPGPAYAAASGQDVLRGATMTSHTFLSDGSTHVRSDELSDLYDRFWQAAEADPSVPQQLAKHFVVLGEDWVAWISGRAAADVLPAASDSELAATLDEFSSRHSGYAPALYLPFPVERRYAEVFPGLVERVAAGLTRRGLTAFGDQHAPVARLLLAARGDVELAVRPVLEQSSLRTNAEGKDAALGALARALVDAYGATSPSTSAELAVQAPRLHEELLNVVQQFGWIAQWGFPPRYTESTPEGMYHEALVRCTALARRSGNVDDEPELPSAADALELAGASASDRQLVSDFAYYNFYRTYRMELLIQAQYHCAKLLAEIGNRTGLDADQRSRLTPPEMVAALEAAAGREAAVALAKEREAGWVLEADGLRDTRTVHSGVEFAAARTRFTAVVRGRENARGEIDATDPTHVGGKGAGLAKLASGGFNVPDFCVVTTSAIARLADTETRPAILAAINDAVTDLAGDGPLAVRSSASVEDGAKQSWAGRFETSLGVDPTPEAVESALEFVVASAGSERVAEYAKRTGTDPDTISMAVVIQRLVDAEYAGVVNTSVASAAGSLMEIEVVRGLGDKLVDGSSTPDGYQVDAAGQVFRTGDEVDLPDAVLGDIIDVARRIEDHFGVSQDVEFAVQDGQVYVLQSRNLTGPGVSTTPSVDEVSNEGLTEVVTGLSGHVAERLSGTAVLPDTPAAGAHLPEGSVLVLKAATPDWDTVVFQAVALVADEGGSTSHAIRVSNELGIPAVVGTRTATRMVRADEQLVVDTTIAGNVGRVLRSS